MKSVLWLLLFPLVLFSQVTTPSDTVRWKFNTDMTIWSSPAIAPNGNILVGNWRNKIFCLSPQGQMFWANSLKKQVMGTPAIDDDGNVYVPSKNIEAYDAVGEHLWTYFTPDIIYSSPAILDDLLIFTADSSLYAIDRATGDSLWAYTLMTGKDEYRNMCSPVIAEDGTIYVGAQDDTLYAFLLKPSDLEFHPEPQDSLDPVYTPEAAVKWKLPNVGVLNSSAAIGEDGTIYFGSYDNHLYAVSPQGELKWKFAANDWVITSPAIDEDGTVYFGSLDKYFYAVNPDSTEKWRYYADSWLNSSPAIGSDGIIYFGSEADFPVYHAIKDSSLFQFADSTFAVNDSVTQYFSLDSVRTYVFKGLKRDGSLKLMYRTDGELRSSPVIGMDGTAYIGSYDNNLYAFHVPSAGLLESAWPCARGNAQRTGRAGDRINVPTRVQTQPVLAQNFVLHANYPNPFNPSTTIKVDVAAASRAELKIYNSLGQLVTVLYNGELAPGVHELVWNAQNEQALPVSSGIYFVRARINDEVQTCKMMLIK